MSKYRKKPVEVEAWQYGQEICTAPEWMRDAVRDEIVRRIDDSVYVITLEGKMKVSENDYIIKGVSGELYPCKSDIFKKTYEKVQEKHSFWK